MARSFNGTPYFRCETSPVSTFPLTMACWATRAVNNTLTLMSIGDTGGENNMVSLRVRNTTGFPFTLAGRYNSGTEAAYQSTLSTSTNTWYHACAVLGSSDRRVYTNGGDVGASAIAYNLSGLDAIGIGVLVYGANNSFPHNGSIAHAAIWNVALTATEVASLYNDGIGADPRSVRPDALVAYWPLIGNDGDRDHWGTYHLTASGSPTYTQHPPVLMRSRPKYVILGAGAPSIATIEIAGTRQVGNTLTCNATSSPSGATFTYQWYMADDIAGTNQTAISGATAQTYELSYANIGAATKLYEGLDANGEAFIACGATPTKDAVTGDETVSSYVSITEASVTAPVGSPFESRYIR